MALPQIAADPKSALQEWAQGRGLPLPCYIERSRSGPDHAPVFESEVRIKGCEPATRQGILEANGGKSRGEHLVTARGRSPQVNEMISKKEEKAVAVG